ncbi:MAG TPA: carbon storage regulator [Peptococcaceae bacterium]|nr:MAG: Carbon storage regulator-like protein [Clostridia bacterium 41_269]HBT20193.1 carbon storage regulator [Peptococcaceae bacterium]
MLVLTRKKNETVVIGSDIFVTVVDVDGDKVKLGINAPRDISIYRKEIYDAIVRENVSASMAQPEDVEHIIKLSRIQQKE